MNETQSHTAQLSSLIIAQLEGFNAATKPHEMRDADREAYEGVKAILDDWAAWAPKPVATCPYAIAGQQEAIALTLNSYRNGAAVSEDDKRVAIQYSDWRNEVTKAECDNAGKLLVLVNAAETLGRLCVKHQSSKTLAADFMRVCGRLKSEYGVSDWPNTPNERMAWVKPATRRYDVMDRKWRAVVHVGGC